MELVLTQNWAVGERQKTHFIRHFLNLKGNRRKRLTIKQTRNRSSSVVSVTESKWPDFRTYIRELLGSDADPRGCGLGSV